jgi:hypothetical protein
MNTGIIDNKSTGIININNKTSLGGTLINNGSINIADDELLTLIGNVSGAGSFVGSTFLNGATVNPGNSPGTLTFGDTTWSNVSLNMEIAGFASGEYDVININGDLNLLNSFAINFDFANGLDFDSVLGQSFNVLNVMGSFTGLDFSSWAIDLVDGWATSWTNENNAWNLALNYEGVDDNGNGGGNPPTDVPEPSTLLLMSFAFGGLFYQRKKRVPDTVNAMAA